MILIGKEQLLVYLILNLSIIFNLCLHDRSNFICDNKHILFGLSDGSLYNISWKGEVCAFAIRISLGSQDPTDA